MHIGIEFIEALFNEIIRNYKEKKKRYITRKDRVVIKI